VATAEICVLDDISRAPGEALNVLLRILNERKLNDHRIPLLCAVATGNPPGDGSYVEALDPATIDRFTIQLRARGIIQDEEW
jgi:MoxR-like ATPase